MQLLTNYRIVIRAFHLKCVGDATEATHSREIALAGVQQGETWHGN